MFRQKTFPREYYTSICRFKFSCHLMRSPSCPRTTPLTWSIGFCLKCFNLPPPRLPAAFLESSLQQLCGWADRVHHQERAGCAHYERQGHGGRHDGRQQDGRRSALHHHGRGGKRVHAGVFPRIIYNGAFRYEWADLRILNFTFALMLLLWIIVTTKPQTSRIKYISIYPADSEQVLELCQPGAEGFPPELLAQLWDQERAGEFYFQRSVLMLTVWAAAQLSSKLCDSQQALQGKKSQ